ncbi:tetratricopeptide repeat protein [Polynucleobacter sp. VK25]|nr:tetratricopeptide repeat protein [Polynucleobacter sp. VK25]
MGIAYAKANRLEEALFVLACLQRHRVNDARIFYNLGLIHSLQGNYLLAIEAYDLALKIQPDNVDALINKSSIYIDIKNYALALEVLESAIKIRPDIPEAWSNKGIALNNLHLYQDSLNAYDKAIDLNSGYFEFWSNKCVPLHKLKRFEDALEACDQALNLNPNYAEAFYNKGNVLNDLKRYDEAIVHYDKALSLKSDYHEAWLNKGMTLDALRRYDEAITHYDKALSLKPDYHEAWLSKGATLDTLKRYDEAIVHYDKALSLKPDYHEAWLNKGVSLYALKRCDEAITHYDKSLSLKQGYHEAWLNKGVALETLKRYDEAIVHYDKALSLKPDYHEAWLNKGMTLDTLKRCDEAIVHYDKALSLKADIEFAPGYLVHAKMKLCSWSGLENSLQDISKRVMANERILPPFPLLALNDDALLHKKCAEIFVEDKYPQNYFLGAIPHRPKNKKIRVGYFSADLKNHPVAFLIAELFEIHDRSRFEIYAFSLERASDEMRDRLHKAFDHFIDVERMSDVAIAQLSRELEIDIAIDLSGFTLGGRTGIFAYRAAPIQVNYLGYPGTMGADYMDYIIADKTLIPDQMQQFYAERVIYLPGSYQVNDTKRVISHKQFTRQELGLPESGFVFCCFNNNFKILPATFAGWMRILKAVEGSVLWLLQDNDWAVENLKKEARQQGVDESRLVFADRVPLSEHLARLPQADLFLDTLPYNAHTTASDALWVGLPVLTAMKMSFASRVASSLLSAIDMPELIAHSQDEYEALAIELALNPYKLLEIKSRLAKNRLTAPLFNTPLFAKNLETAYLKMYDRYQAGLKPENIYI